MKRSLTLAHWQSRAFDPAINYGKPSGDGLSAAACERPQAGADMGTEGRTGEGKQTNGRISPLLPFLLSPVQAFRPAGFLACLIAIFLPALTTARAATLRWTGAHGTSSDWSRGANWDTGTAPANGDTLVFPAGAARLANNNDLTGLQVAIIRFAGAGGGYTLSGNGVVVTDAITAANTAGNNTIALARLTLANPMSFTVVQPSLSLAMDSEVRLNGNDLTADATGFLVLRGVISGEGNLTKIGDGLLTLSGPVGNTFTGNLRVNAGSVFLGKTAGLAVTNRLIIGDGTGGSQADGVGMLADNQVSAVTVNASGLWSLGNFENEVSDLVLNRGGDVTTGATGKLRLGPGAGITVNPATDATPNLSTIFGFLELAAGTHVITVGENDAPVGDLAELEIGAVISGIGLGGITKEGAGDLELSGNNTFAGQVIINEGELRVSHASALGAIGNLASTTVNNDASLGVIAVDVGDETLRLNSTGRWTLRTDGPGSWSGDIELQRDAQVAVASVFTLSGVISGRGNLSKEAFGVLRLSGNNPNTFTGDLLVNQGTVELDKGTIGGLAVPGRLIVGDGLGGAGADLARHRKDNQVNQVTVNGSGLWSLGVFQEEVSDLDLNDGGDITTAATGLLRLGIGAGVTVGGNFGFGASGSEIAGNFELLAGSHQFRVDNSTGSPGGLDLIATVTGAGGIEKTGQDTLFLRGSNSFLGLVTINQGSLAVHHGSGLGSPILGTHVNSGGRLELDILPTHDPVIDDELLNIDHDAAAGTALLVERPATWTGPVTLLHPTRIDLPVNASLELDGLISGAGGIIKDGEGTLTLSGSVANTYTGVTTLNEGRLHLNKTAGADAVVGALVIGDGTGGANADVVQCLGIGQIAQASAVTVNSSGRFEAGTELIGSLAGSGNVVINSSLSAGYDNSSTTFDGVLSGAGQFVKQGTGILTLNGNNTYSGATAVVNGQLIINGQQPSSDVTVGSFSAFPSLAGIGRVGNLSTFFDRGTISPGLSPGRLTSRNLLLTAGSHYQVELNGPTPGATHDQLRVFGTVDLGGADLQATLNFIPTLGQSLVIIDNDGTDAVVDRFDGLSEGDTLRVNQIPFVISYRGGDGNDVTLTATNRSLSLVSTRVEAGNGNGVIDANECDHLFVALMNETGNPLAVSQVVLDSATPGVAVTQPRSDYAVFGPLGIRTNRVPFQIRTTPDFVCGQLIDFLLTVTLTGGGGGTFTIPFTVPSGGAGTPVLFNHLADTSLVDEGELVSTLNVSGAAPHVGKVTVGLYIVHPSAGDLVLRLRSPSGTIVTLAENLGGATDNYGGSCAEGSRTTFDDAAATRIAAATAPFVGSFTPEEPLAAFLGENPNGDWQLLVTDTVAGDTGVLHCWYLSISPPDCTDGGGACESCLPALTGRFTADMPSTTTRLFRNNIPSGCGSPKACPAVVTGARLFYRVHLVTNNGPETCVTAVLADLCRASNLRLHAAAYLTSYNPADPCANYLGDTGSELTTASTSFSFTAPQNAVIALVVDSPVSATTCPVSYLVQLHGLPCPPPTLHIARTGNPDEVRLFWSTAYPDFDLQLAPSLNGAAPYPFENVPFTPLVVNGDYSVTNRSSAPKAFYRLHQP